MTTPNRNDTSLTLDDLILRVAESAGLADYSGDTAAVPSSAHDYDLCKRAVNDGIELIYRAYTGWSFLNQDVEWLLSTDGTGAWCIDSDPARYRLPWYVMGQPIEATILVRDTGNTCYRVPVVAPRIVHEARASGGATGLGSTATTSGAPRVAAVDRSVGSLAQRAAWEIIFYPDPDKAYTARASFRSFAPKMVEPTERHCMGAEHDQTVVAAGIYAMKKTDSKDKTEREDYRKEYEAAVAQSIELDKQMVPRTLGQVTDPSIYVGSWSYDTYDIGPRNITAAQNGVA